MVNPLWVIRTVTRSETVLHYTLGSSLHPAPSAPPFWILTLQNSLSPSSRLPFHCNQKQNKRCSRTFCKSSVFVIHHMSKTNLWYSLYSSPCWCRMTANFLLYSSKARPSCLFDSSLLLNSWKCVVIKDWEVLQMYVVWSEYFTCSLPVTAGSGIR